MNRTEFRCLVLWIICFLGVCHIRYLQTNETKEVTLDIREVNKQTSKVSTKTIIREASELNTY
jgi:hypothetical protein